MVKVVGLEMLVLVEEGVSSEDFRMTDCYSGCLDTAFSITSPFREKAREFVVQPEGRISLVRYLPKAVKAMGKLEIMNLLLNAEEFFVQHPFSDPLCGTCSLVHLVRATQNIVRTHLEKMKGAVPYCLPGMRLQKSCLEGDSAAHEDLKSLCRQGCEEMLCQVAGAEITERLAPKGTLGLVPEGV